ncbi:oligosaccharide flippase family protein [Flammeovirgaceae bacterium SG7u.111]|nr:oligosaccharide flippase family protein [Flammeovirgaceae bacterium SG7u.132]WPO38251.1 oligosaccharide flippase family protein [Flammeovirgaceae bacterium SG7u.111]
MSLKKNFFKNILTVGFFAYLAQAFSYLASIFIFRIISPEEYGVVSMIVVFSGFIAIFSDAGFSFSVIRGNYNEDFLQRLSGATVLFGLLLSLILALFAQPISWFYGSPELLTPTLCLATTFFLQSFSIIPKAKLQKEEAFKFIGIATVATQGANSAVQLTLAYLGFSYWAFIWGPIVGYTIQACMYLWKTKLIITYGNARETQKVISEVKSLVGHVSGFNLINYWARNSDYLMIGKLYDKATLGVYRNAYFLLMLPLNFVGLVVNQVLLPTLQKVIDTGQSIEKEYKYVEGAVTLLMLPVSLLFIIFPEPFIQLLWGEKWRGVAEYLPYFGVLCYCQATLYPIGVAFVLLKKEKEMFKAGGFNALVLIVAIVSGAFISVKMMVFTYSVAYFLICCPIVIYIGFIKSFGFDKQQAISYWLPRLLLGLAMLIGIHFDYLMVAYVALGLLSVLTIVKEYSKVFWVWNYIFEHLKTKV